MTQNSRFPTQTTNGFTLIEVMIVIGIFAVISAVCYSALTQYISVTEKLEQKEQNQQKLQKLFTLMEKDFRYIVNRSVRDEYGDEEPAFELDRNSEINGEFVRFTTIHPDYENQSIGKIIRVAWSVDSGELYRNTWPNLDRADATEFRSVKVIDNVEAVEIGLYKWDDTFQLQSADTFDDGFAIPYGVRVTLTMRDGFEYFRLFDVANGS